MPPGTDGPTTHRFALRGRIVTLDDNNTVLDDGVVYVGDRVIDAVLPAEAPAPPGFEQVTPVVTGGTVYPGLIELHNHLPYDVLPLWNVPKRYGNRSQWGGSRNPAYRTLVTGPMRVLGEDPELMPAVVRYVEAKALINGTTTTQGIALFSNAGARRMYRGIVRNVEATGDPDLPEAGSRIADVEAEDAEKFLARLKQPHRLLLHLAEGTDRAAREHFLALKIKAGRWAITENLVGIHCAGLPAEDFRVLADHGASMVWSPLSNLLLYGGTADIAAARRAGVLMGLGSDWSVSGSKGLLGELKAARLAADVGEVDLTDRDLVAMATRDAARILRWERAVGSLRPGLRADLLITAGTADDPYTALVRAGDADIRLVVIDGVARYGLRDLVKALASGEELEKVSATGAGGRVVNLHDAAGDPLVAGLTLADATDRLTTALADLPALAARPPRPAPLTGALAGGVRWQLALDELAPTGAELRPRLGLSAAGRTHPTGPEPGPATAAVGTLTPLTLDGLTAGADSSFGAVLAQEINLPADYGARLAQLLT